MAIYAGGSLGASGGTVSFVLARFSAPTPNPVVAAHTAIPFQRVTFDPSGGTFQIDMPASPTFGDRVGVKNVTASATAVTVSGNGANIDNPVGLGVYLASVSVGGAGVFATWEFDGTRWGVVAA